jgi:diaminohydroxyphosphoribosylaminopyrimidine deaminase/5-amino-6-(5-phosphoribosylamino)uracil reductase
MHNPFMLSALEQAWFGRGSCAPNPAVGALLVHNEVIIAKAFHEAVGTAHAERQVLEHMPKGLDGAILYTTLEPCNHWGRTPPCTKAIIEAGIKTVVFGFKDPNPLVSDNNTTALLTEQGIEVLYNPLPEIDDFYQSYAYWMKTGLPWVSAKIAQSLDGKIAGKGGKRVHLSNQTCEEFTHKHRLHTDVILTTAKTVIQDNPNFTAKEIANPTNFKSKVIAVLDAKLTLTSDRNIFNTAQHVLIFYDQDQPTPKQFKNCSYHPVPAQEGLLNLPAILSHLGKLGFHDLWVEAGGRLFSALHDQKLVQKTYLYLVPRILGENTTLGYHDADFFNPEHRISWYPAKDNIIACIDWKENTCLQE